MNRRFTQVAEINGIKIIDDYGHHPVEISAVLNAARQTSKEKYSQFISHIATHV